MQYCLSFLLLLSSFASAVPTVRKRIVDLDGNGIPDWCGYNSDGSANCLENGQWTLVPASIASPKTVAPAAAPAPTPLKVNSQAQAASFKTSFVPAVASQATSSQAVINSQQTSSHSTSTSSTTTRSTPASLSTASLPAPAQFKSDNGTKWTISYVGDIKYTGALAGKNLMGDKCRTGKIGNSVIWNCGDMMCPSDYTVCGFGMGPAFYGTSDVMTINTDNVQYVQNNNLMLPWSGDTVPQSPQTAWGMDTSNVVTINDTHGVAFAWEIWRGASDGSIVERGNAVSSVTLGQTMPIATRMGPLLTDNTAIALGLVAILRDGNYIYIYSEAGPSKLTVTRVPADDRVFDASKYESLVFGTANTWQAGIPLKTDNKYGMQTANGGGQFGCAVYGSAFYSAYLKKYVIVCNIYMTYTNMYTSDTPYGPWSAEYGLLSGWHGYGSMAHPEYFSADGRTWYFSQGPNEKFNMFKIQFNY